MLKCDVTPLTRKMAGELAMKSRIPPDGIVKSRIEFDAYRQHRDAKPRKLIRF